MDGQETNQDDFFDPTGLNGAQLCQNINFSSTRNAFMNWCFEQTITLVDIRYILASAQVEILPCTSTWKSSLPIIRSFS